VRVIDAPGFYRIAARDYHADPCIVPSLSSGVAETIVMKSPLHGWHAHPRLNPEFRSEERTEFDIGSAAHALLLEGEDRMTVIPFADYRKQEARDLRDAARAPRESTRSSRTATTTCSLCETPRAARSRHARIWPATRSTSATPSTPSYGERARRRGFARARIGTPRAPQPASNPLLFLDYKSTANACPSWFTTQLVRMGYAFQQAFYRRGAREIFGVDPRFVFMAQDVEAAVSVLFPRGRAIARRNRRATGGACHPDVGRVRGGR
jgi:hypothetical protein